MSSNDIEASLSVILKPAFKDGPGCSLNLFRFAAKEMTPSEAQAFQQHLRGCPACQQDLGTFHRLVVPDQGSSPVSRSLFASLKPSGALALAASLLLVLAAGVGYLAFVQTRHQSGFIIKGGYKLHLAAQRDSRRFVARSGDQFQAGDMLGFFYTAPQDTWLVVMFADREGSTTRLFPTTGLHRIPSGVERPLPDGAVLDPGEGCEWIVAFFSAKKPIVAQLEAALRAAIKNRGRRCELTGLETASTFVDVIVLRRGLP